MPAPLAARLVGVVAVLLVIAAGCRATPQTTMLFDEAEASSAVDADPFNPDNSQDPDEAGGSNDADGNAGIDAEGDDAMASDALEADDDEPEDIDRGGRNSPLDSMERIETEPTPTPRPTAIPDPASLGALDGGEVDFTLTRDDVDCDDDALNDAPDTPFLVAHYVVNGNLGAPCFGEPDERLTLAWQILAEITPSGQLRDLGLFGGYTSRESGETTLAFVNALDFDGSLYQMSINLDEAEADPDELMLTMAHEFTHVFTSLSTQLDRNVSSFNCTTFYNGEGCYLEDSLMADWIELFWGDGLIDQIDGFDPASNATGQERCNIYPGFLGPYAASTPEEDFAETFSGYVFRLEVDTPELQAKFDWFDDQPGLVEFQELAVAAGFGPLENRFEDCG